MTLRCASQQTQPLLFYARLSMQTRIVMAPEVFFAVAEDSRQYLCRAAIGLHRAGNNPCEMITFLSIVLRMRQCSSLVQSCSATSRSRSRETGWQPVAPALAGPGSVSIPNRSGRPLRGGEPRCRGVHSKARGLPWTRWGQRPQTCIRWHRSSSCHRVSCRSSLTSTCQEAGRPRPPWLVPATQAERSTLGAIPPDQPNA